MTQKRPISNMHNG